MRYYRHQEGRDCSETDAVATTAKGRCESFPMGREKTSQWFVAVGTALRLAKRAPIVVAASLTTIISYALQAHAA